MIEVADLTKTYGAGQGIDAIGFSVKPGENVGLLGPNGAGKTTTLKVLSGITRPHSGSVKMGGFDLLRDPVAAKRTLSFVSDEPRLFDELTVDEHLAFFARLYQAPEGHDRGRRILQWHGLADRLDAFPAELSRGMVQTVSVACALLHRPRCLLLDEPLTGLDPNGMRRMRQTMLDAAAQGTAVLLSSHLLPLVESLCHRLIVMSRGRVVAEGTIAEIRQRLGGARHDTSSLEELFVALTEPSAEGSAAGPIGAPPSRDPTQFEGDADRR
jgi:ABC-2 type transport system ATP-binding protein